MSVDARTRSDEKLLQEAQDFVEKTQGRLDRDREVSEDRRQQLMGRLNKLRHAIKENDTKALRVELAEAQGLAEQHLTPTKSTWREYAESIGLAILFALILRGFVIEAFKIPTGSMIPTLQIGDHLFVNKFIYGIRVPFTQTFVARFAEPQRGEVVVFVFPRAEAREYLAGQPISRRECIDRASLEKEREFIKRIVGVEGDTVELRDNRLLVNGEPVPRTFLRKEKTGNYLYPDQVQEREELGEGSYTIQWSGGNRNFGPIKVKPGHVFAMGDNRDNSSDSRCWGQVPVENIEGRAMIIWWSIGPDGIRWNRIGGLID